MRRTGKILAMLLALCMIVSLLPAYALADSKTGPSAMSEFSLGDPNASYKLSIVNDAAAKMVYEVKINGDTEQVAIEANSTLSIGVNEGDKYEVTKIGNTNYTVTEESATFLNEEDGYTAVIGKTFSHKVGDGFKTGEDISYFLKDGNPYVGDIETKNIGGQNTAIVKGSYKSYTVTVGSLSKTSATITFKDGSKTLGTTKASSDYTTVSQAVVDKATPVLQAAGDAYFKNSVMPLYTTGEEANRENVYATFTGTYTPKAGCTDPKVNYGVSGSYQIYIPLEARVTDITDELALGDITLTYTANPVAKAGNLQFDVLNGERLNAVNEKIDADFLIGLLDSELGKSLTGGLMGEDDAAAPELTVDTLINVLKDPA